MVCLQFFISFLLKIYIDNQRIAANPISRIYYFGNNIRKKNKQNVKKGVNRWKIKQNRLKKVHIYIVESKKCVPLQSDWKIKNEILGSKPREY